MNKSEEERSSDDRLKERKKGRKENSLKTGKLPFGMMIERNQQRRERRCGE